MNGKGSTPRPLSISQAEYARNYTRTFPKKAPRSLQERERLEANDYAEHGRRLRMSQRFTLAGTRFPDQTVNGR